LVSSTTSAFSSLELSPPASVGTRSTGITGLQGPTRWRGDGSSPRRRYADARASLALQREAERCRACCSVGVRDGQVEFFVGRYPFPSQMKRSERSVKRSAITCALSASGNTLGQSLNRRLVVMQV